MYCPRGDALAAQMARTRPRRRWTEERLRRFGGVCNVWGVRLTFLPFASAPADGVVRAPVSADCVWALRTCFGNAHDALGAARMRRKRTTLPNGRLPGVSGIAPRARPQRARCRARAAPGAMAGGCGRPKKEDAGARGPEAPPRPGKCNPCFYVQRDGKPRRDTVPRAELRRCPAARPQQPSLSGRGGCPQ